MSPLLLRSLVSVLSQLCGSSLSYACVQRCFGVKESDTHTYSPVLSGDSKLLDGAKTKGHFGSCCVI